MSDAQDAEYRYKIGLSCRVIVSHANGIADMVSRMEATPFDPPCLADFERAEAALLKLQKAKHLLLAKQMAAA